MDAHEQLDSTAAKARRAPRDRPDQRVLAPDEAAAGILPS